MWAVGATALVSFGLTVFAVQSKVSSVTLGTRFAAQPPVNAPSLCCAARGRGGDAAGRKGKALSRAVSRSFPRRAGCGWEPGEGVKLWRRLLPRQNSDYCCDQCIWHSS